MPGLLIVEPDPVKVPPHVNVPSAEPTPNVSEARGDKNDTLIKVVIPILLSLLAVIFLIIVIVVIYRYVIRKRHKL